MFSNPIRPSYDLDEGTVVQVDPIRCLCKVKTLTGQVLHAVQYLLPSGGSTRGADRFTPLVGDRVMLSFGLGYPVILGFLPRLQTEEGSQALSINTGEQLIDTGNYSPDGGISWGDQNKPKDMLYGDRLISSIGGGLLGLLRGGAVLLRANRGAELFMSNFHNLVRIVARNWEHFTDVSSDVVRNYKNKVYRYVGYAKTFAEARLEDYKLHFYYGDVKAGETIQTRYNGYYGDPATDTNIYKEQVTGLISGTPSELMRRTLKVDGEQEFWITNGTHFTRVKSTAEELIISWNDQNTIVINEAKIHAYHKDGADYIMDALGIRATFHDGNINMSDGSIVTTFDTGTVTMDHDSITTEIGGSTIVSTASDITSTIGGSSIFSDGSGITLTNGAGTTFVSPAETRMTNGGHSVTITAGGVAIT